MSHARSETAEYDRGISPNVARNGLGEDRDPDGDDQACEMRRAPTDADGDDCDERRDEGGHERGDHRGRGAASVG